MRFTSVLGRTASAVVLAGACLVSGGAGSVAHADPAQVITGPVGIGCDTVSSCWQVGAGSRWASLQHWDGHHWTTTEAPHPAGSDASGHTTLNAVTCPGPHDCWAVGTGETTAQSVLSPTYIVHWNGHAWKLVDGPARQMVGDYPQAVSCSSATSCSLVGFTGSSVNEPLVEHWNGKVWARQPVANPAGHRRRNVDLTGVSCVPGGCWATGLEYSSASYDATAVPFVMRPSGGRWVTVSTPAAAAWAQPSIACASLSSCWVVGSTGAASPQGVGVNWAIRWDGKHWTRATLPSPGGRTFTVGHRFIGASNSTLRAISCSAPDNCSAVGTYLNAKTIGYTWPQALHWNGKVWAVVPPPNRATALDNTLVSVSCLPGGACWAVGGGDRPRANEKQIIARWNGKRWIG